MTPRVKSFLKALSLAMIALFFVASNAFAAQSSSGTDCSKCHNDLVVNGFGKPYVHAPFMELQCDVCHVDNSRATESNRQNFSAGKIEISERSIKWFDFTSSPASESRFFVPAEFYGNAAVVVSAISDQGKNYKQIFELPPVETLEVKTADKNPPIIKASEVRGVYRGVLVSARIGWLTDKMADSEVRYGIESLQLSVREDALVTEHEVVLQNLKANQKYHFVVMSRDVFGNSAVSASGSFSTEKLQSLEPERYVSPKKADIRLEAEFFLCQDSYLMKIKANQPVILKIGKAAVFKRNAKVTANSFENRVSETDAGEPNHPSLRNMDDISSVCRKCHAEMFGRGNHAINVMPSAGMILPANYSTDSHGQITCITCHDPHASDYRYITVAPHEKELCVGCHKGYDLPAGQRNQPMIMVKRDIDRSSKGGLKVNFMAQR